MRAFRLLLLGLLNIAILAVPCSLSLAAPPPTRGVQLRPIGTPAWAPVDFHLFSAPIGTDATGFAEFFTTVLSLLPPPNHLFHLQLTVGPGTPHSPPYDSELALGVGDQGFDEGPPFHFREFSGGNGVFLAWMNVPAPGTTGSSPDFGSGPIIPNSLFPISVSGVSIHNGAPFDPFLVSLSVLKLDANLTPPFFVDGHSHFPVFVADSLEFGPPGVKPLGHYLYTLTMTDQEGNGWFITARFAVVP